MVLSELNKWCVQCGGRFTAICPDCNSGACWFCERHKEHLFCEICERETDLPGDWVDGTRLVDDSLSLNFQDMGSFLISKIRGVRLADKGRRRECSDEDMLERLWSARNVRPMLLPTRWWSRALEPRVPSRIGEEMLGFNNEAQGWVPCKIVEAPQENLWTVDWWDNSQGDRTKGEEGLRPFERQGGGTGLYRRLRQKDVYTVKTRMEHMGNGE